MSLVSGEGAGGAGDLQCVTDKSTASYGIILKVILRTILKNEGKHLMVILAIITELQPLLYYENFTV